MKATQVYPPAFGQTICTLHNDLIVGLACIEIIERYYIVHSKDDYIFVLIHGQARGKEFELKTRINMFWNNASLKKRTKPVWG